MVFIITYLVSFILCFSSVQEEVKLVYLDQKPEDISKVLVYKKVGTDNYDRIEKILKDAEKDLYKYAESQNNNLIEVFIVEQSHGVLPTESQFGKKGYVTLWVCFKKT